MPKDLNHFGVTDHITLEHSNAQVSFYSFIQIIICPSQLCFKEKTPPLPDRKHRARLTSLCYLHHISLV